jgi:DNA adenine methylase
MSVAEGYCDRAYFSEIDASVASVWSCALSTGTELAHQVENFKVTKKHVDELFRHASNDATSVQRALAVLVRNRVHRGGVLAEGAGRLKKGENGKGIRSRWYPETIPTPPPSKHRNSTRSLRRKAAGTPPPSDQGIHS